MNRKIFAFISFFICLISCQEQSNIIKNNKMNENFIVTLNKFKILDSNFILNNECFYPEEDCKYCNRIDTKNDLPYFYKKQSMATSIGLLPDTSRFYVLLYCEAAECYVPSLAVYTKQGILIDDKPIHFLYGSDCGYENSNLVSLKSKNILQSKYQEESYSCDSLGKPITGTWIKFQELYSYEITNSGKIKVSKVRKNIFKK